MVQLVDYSMSELGLSGNGAPGMSTGSGGSVGQFGSGHGSLYGSSGLAANMGSLQNIARSQPGPGQARSQQLGAPGSGLGPGLGALQGRLTPTQFGSRSMGGLGQPGMSLLQSSSSSSRNPLFSRKMGDGSLGSGPNTFDPSEFPSLGAGSGGGGLAGRPNYVGMVKQPSDHSGSDFLISNEDFPALPGAPVSSFVFSEGGPGGAMLEMNKMKLNSTGLSGLSLDQEMAKTAQARKGIQTSQDGLVTNIPPNMVVDQFGMIGLLTFIRAAETDPNLVSLALGADLTTLGLNLNSEVNLFPTFGGPWAETPCRPQDIDFHVPHEYLTNTAIREKLAPVKLNRYKDDILFYMFYTNVGDVLQLAAAAELYNRDWRYHKEERVWITRAQGMVPIEKTATYERGTYYFFDVNCWRKVPKEFHLDYDKLEDRPSLPSSLTGGGGPAGSGAGQPGSQSSVGGPGHQPGPVSGSPSPLAPPPPQPSGGSSAL